MSYKVWVESSALKEAQATPGNVRQRLKKAFQQLQNNPRPAGSKTLDWSPEPFEPRRWRIDQWRIVYAVDDSARWIWILAVRKRPPYDYGDLADLLRQIGK